jgi:hypothetical protein
MGADGGHTKQWTLDVSNTNKGLLPGMVLGAKLHKYLSYHFIHKHHDS